MATNTSSATVVDDNALGNFLKACRSRLDPAMLGFSTTRRRTPGLRREEVAQRADVSATWYTWLEQGRGGAPSAEVLDRIADALALTPVEREHLFLLAHHRPPEARYEPNETVTPRLQRLLDSFELNPAVVKTATWDVVAWNRAAAAVLADYAKLVPEERNVLRLVFCDSRLRDAIPDWEGYARFVVGAFRADVARAGASEKVRALVDELRRFSSEFEAMWRENDVRAPSDGVKQFHHPIVGSIALEFSSFAVDGQPDLSMVIFTPATQADKERISALLRSPAMVR
jgi:transcriptional regulator with XRE-family HTH domain